MQETRNLTTKMDARRWRSVALRCGLPILVVFGALWTTSASAQLVDCNLIDANGNVNAPGGCIARSLQDQIGPGQGSINLFGSSIYIVKRDPARAVRRGRQLFQRKFSLSEGSGPRVNPASAGDITQARALGAGFADSCAACHGRPRGSAGFGGDVNTFPDSRDAPHLFGLGLQEMLADEMTADLRAIRQAALNDAQGGGGSQTLLSEDFDNGTGGFTFVDDTFNGTNNPAYASGTQTFIGTNGALEVDLGGIDNATVLGMSGGFSRTFNVPSAATVKIRFRFQLTQAEAYESDEFSDGLISVDGNDFFVARITGNGNGGGAQIIGPVFTEFDVPLTAGTHTLTLGGFNNKKTFNNEFTAVFYDDLEITVGGGSPGPVTRSLDAKGINFGTITAFPDGTVDTSDVDGVDADLRVRPFFAQGATVSMREFAIGAFNDEMGIQAVDPILCAVTDPNNPQAMTSPAGFHYDPTTDTFERPKACDVNADPDGDGVANEYDAALVDFMEFYLLNYFKPGQYRQSGRTQRGQELMAEIGCTSCHVQNLTVNRDRRVADVETQFDPVNGVFNELFATASTRFQVVPDGDEFPQVLPLEQSFVVRNIYTDFKRHDLGPAFEERDFDGSRLVEHITEPLWGVGSTAPYGHDGRSINLDAVIRRHGGEAAATTVAYASLSDNDRRRILEFLESLVLFAPDDTASSLEGGEGNPGTTDPQTPSEHGFINLGALFQIDSLGPE